MAIGVFLPTPSGGSFCPDILKPEVVEGGTNYIDWEKYFTCFSSFMDMKILFLLTNFLPKLLRTKGYG